MHLLVTSGKLFSISQRFPVAFPSTFVDLVGLIFQFRAVRYTFHIRLGFVPCPYSLAIAVQCRLKNWKPFPWSPSWCSCYAFQDLQQPARVHCVCYQFRIDLSSSWSEDSFGFVEFFYLSSSSSAFSSILSFGLMQFWGDTRIDDWYWDRFRDGMVT